MDLRIENILQRSIVIGKTNSSKEARLDTIDDQLFDRLRSNNLGNRAINTRAGGLWTGKELFLRWLDKA